MGDDTAGDERHTLALIDALADRLADAGVRYCHWKSNESIARSLTGENDLDLLVDPEDAATFHATLSALGFVRVRPPGRRMVPGIEDHLGLDRPTGRVVHVQPHFQLRVGDDMTKSFRLPVARVFLEGRSGGPFPLPRPEIEYLVFLIRMTIKHCPLEALVARKGRLTPGERRELTWLEERIEPGVVATMRGELFPQVPAELWDALRRAIRHDAGLAERAMTGRRLLRALRSLSVRPLAADAALKQWRRAVTALTSDERSGKRLAAGGLLVAVVGGDGSGKSTLVEGLTRTFAPVIRVRRIHLGKPPRGLLNRILTRPLRVLRARGAFRSTRLPAWVPHDTHPGLVFSLWHWLIARDRHRLHGKARRWAARGELVISDRFPLPWVTSMDGPRLSGLPEAGWLSRVLAAAEASLYERMSAPDALLVLRLPPAIAVDRRRDQDAAFVDRRAREIWEVDWDAHGAVVLDASKPQDDVLADALTVVWELL